MSNAQGSNILEVLKKKMRATKEECDKYKEDFEDLQRKLQVEIMRREEVR
jgi:tropomyosin-1